MDLVVALAKRWGHCLVHFHRPVDLRGEVRIITCECGRMFYSRRVTP